jgi:hypothetical protein
VNSTPAVSSALTNAATVEAWAAKPPGFASRRFTVGSDTDEAFARSRCSHLSSALAARMSSAQPCLICGRRPSDAHHLRFAQPRALGRRVSDEYTVPLCRSHHRALHRCGDEAAWWKRNSVDPIAVAAELWQRTRLDGPRGGRIEALVTVGVIEASGSAGQ